MKQAVLVLQGLATAALMVAAVFVSSKAMVTLAFLPPRVQQIPYVYFFSTISTILSVIAFFILSHAWMKDALPPRFISAMKVWATTTLLLTMLQAMILISVVWQEIRSKKKDAPRRTPTAERRIEEKV